MDRRREPPRFPRLRPALQLAGPVMAATLVVTGSLYGALYLALRDSPPPAPPSAAADAGAGLASGECAPTMHSRREVAVAIPEVYELANIALTLSEYAERHGHTVWRRGTYYEEVMGHFGPHRDHALIRALNRDLIGRDDVLRYYAFRENSAAYGFRNGELVRTTDRRYWSFADAFTPLVELVADFAKETGFRTFFQRHEPFYADQVRRYRELVDIADMWDWLEQRFPQRYDGYHIMFSPLIHGSHSTQRIGERETAMFIAGPDIGDVVEERMRAALLARIVFTEIDHNYVNPTTDRHRAAVDAAFADVPFWNADPHQYGTPYATFNEYMTWAVYSLYLRHRHAAVAGDAIEHTARVMERRGFPQFEEFNRAFLELAEEKGSDCIPELYEPVLEWTRAFQARDRTIAARPAATGAFAPMARPIARGLAAPLLL